MCCGVRKNGATIGGMTTAYLMISGAITAFRAAEFVTALAPKFDRVITVQTPNAKQLISPRDLARIDKNHVVESYFDERILPKPEPGPVLFAPCNFNTLNKLAAGIADNLALSITHEMLGYGQPVTVALSLNTPLYAHPIVQVSMRTLNGWGMRVVPPEDHGVGMIMAPTERVLAAFWS
jgi:phosphopantothenoylcysteine decarboxylase/phosphopantothenate--cysteine ligase